MKDINNEKINQLVTIKSFMEELTAILNQEEQSQLLIEEETYELMNNADISLNNSQEACTLFNEISTCLCTEQIADNSCEACMCNKKEKMMVLINNIIDTSNTQRVSSRNLERYVVKRSEIFQELKSSMDVMADFINQAAESVNMVMPMDSNPKG